MASTESTFWPLPRYVVCLDLSQPSTHISLELVIFSVHEHTHTFFCVCFGASFFICIDMNVLNPIRKQFHNYSSVLRIKKKNTLKLRAATYYSTLIVQNSHYMFLDWGFLSFIFPYYWSQGRNLNVIFNTSIIFLCLMFTSSVSQLTPWSLVLLEKPVVPSLLKNWPTFRGTQAFIPV